MQEQIDAVNARIEALVSVLGAVIPTLSPLQAAQAAVHLKISIEERRALEDPEDSPPTIQARESIAEGFLALLSAVG